MTGVRTFAPTSAVSALAANNIPTEGNDVLYGSNVDGLGGNDTITGTTGSDVLMGGAGNDVLTGSYGNDTLIGGSGADTYLFDEYSGSDVVIINDTNPQQVDRINLLNVAEQELSGFQRIGDDLIIKWQKDQKDTVQQVTLKDVYLDATHQLAILELDKFLTNIPIEFTMRQVFERYTVSLTSGDDTIGPSDLSEHVNGDAGNDRLTMGAGNDDAVGGVGDDTLDGGTGNDSLYGGDGNDTVVLRLGAGSDTIVNGGGNPVGRIDLLKFEDVPSTGLTAVIRSGDHLILKYGATDEVTMKYHFAVAGGTITHVEFSDGQTWDMAQLYAAYDIRLTGGDDTAAFPANLAENVRGGAGNDTIDGLGGNDMIYGEGGDDSLTGGIDNDELYGGDGLDTLFGGIGKDLLEGELGADSLMGEAGNDVLRGGAGNDTLDGGAGDDLLDGGTGNDTLTGGAGNDTYVFRLGSGVDTVYAADSTVGRIEVVVFEDIVASQLTSVTRSANSLVLTYGTADKVWVSNQFVGAWLAVDSFQFADGKAYTAAELEALGSAMTAGTGDAALVGVAPLEMLG